MEAAAVLAHPGAVGSLGGPLCKRAEASGVGGRGTPAAPPSRRAQVASRLPPGAASPSAAASPSSSQRAATRLILEVEDELRAVVHPLALGGDHRLALLQQQCFRRLGSGPPPSGAARVVDPGGDTDDEL